MPRLDPHSHADSDQPDIVSIDWEARVDFGLRRLLARATLELSRPLAAGTLDLDTRGLDVESVVDASGSPLPWQLDADAPILGSRLRVRATGTTPSVTVRYRTGPSASALQWLEPEQTTSRTHPFLYSQCQAIHARSVVPCQDTPRVRVRYRARLTVPASLRGLMAARFLGREERAGEAIESWEMPEPIPPYLLAFAVGDLAERAVGPRSSVWAEPAVVDRAAWEFAGIDTMLRTAESLFGPYDWERFDVLVMPPAFPYGGMENPRLTFLTPTLLAGDRSLVSVVAHELAHSWTGNLVTNASAEHFWLNEGWTVFAERRIVEALEGAEMVALHAALGRRSLDRALKQHQARPDLTRLRTHLQGVDPDDAFSVVPYEKGYLFLRALEEAVGRPAWDALLRRYVRDFRFRSIDTDTFLRFVEDEAPGALAAVDFVAWVDHPGLPSGAPILHSRRLDALAAFRGHIPDDETARAWTAAEWQLYLEGQDSPADPAFLDELDGRFHFSASPNAEIRVAWLTLGCESGRPAAAHGAVAFLGEVGRMKYLRPLYQAMAARAEFRGLARETFVRCRGRYHPIARALVERLLGPPDA